MNLDQREMNDEGNPDEVRNLDDQRRENPNPNENRLSTRDLAAGAAARTARDVNNADDARRPMSAPGSSTDDKSAPLFETGQAEQLRSQWVEIQTKFVDEPRRSVEEADQLVASAIKTLAEVFANERAGLEHNWDHGDDVSTEDLRVALQKYRSFFDRLLSV